MLKEHEMELLDKAILLLNEYENPPDVEVSLDWSSDKLSNAMSLALAGQLEETVESILFEENELFEDTKIWLSEALAHVESRLNDEVSGDLESLESIEKVMREVNRKIDQFEIETRSCCPVPIPGESVNVVMNFHNACSNYMSGLALMARTINAPLSCIMDQIPESISHFTGYLQHQVVHDDFKEGQSFPDGDLSMLADDHALDNNIGFCLPLNYSELADISSRVREGRPFEIVITNPVIAAYDGDSSGDYSCAGYPFKDSGRTIVIDNQLLANELVSFVIDTNNTNSRRYIDDCRMSHTEVRDVSPPVESSPNLLKMNLVKAVLSGDPDLLDKALIESDFLFKEMSLNESIGGWNLMHYAALIDSVTGRERMLRYLASHQVNPSIQAPELQLNPLDLYMRGKWLTQRLDGAVDLTLSDDELQLFVDVGMQQSCGDDIESVLDEDSKLNLLAKRVIKANETGAGVIKRKSIRL